MADGKAASEKSIDDDYERAGFGGELPFGRKPALIAVDMALAYLDPGCVLNLGEAGRKALDRTETLCAAFQAKDLPIVVTRVAYAKGMREAGLFYRKARALKSFEEGSPFARLPDSLTAIDDAIHVTKHYPSAFFGTSLATTLHTLGVDTVVITGYSTSGCVRATTLDALQYGFAPYVASDACADRAPPPHNASLFDLQAKYAEVKPTAEILRLLECVKTA